MVGLIMVLAQMEPPPPTREEKDEYYKGNSVRHAEYMRVLDEEIALYKEQTRVWDEIISLSESRPVTAKDGGEPSDDTTAHDQIEAKRGEQRRFRGQLYVLCRDRVAYLEGQLTELEEQTRGRPAAAELVKADVVKMRRELTERRERLEEMSRRGDVPPDASAETPSNS